jgi:hypothetical protein
MFLFAEILTFHFRFSDIQDYNHFIRRKKSEATGERGRRNAEVAEKRNFISVFRSGMPAVRGGFAQ